MSSICIWIQASPTLPSSRKGRCPEASHGRLEVHRGRGGAQMRYSWSRWRRGSARRSRPLRAISASVSPRMPPTRGRKPSTMGCSRCWIRRAATSDCNVRWPERPGLRSTCRRHASAGQLPIADGTRTVVRQISGVPPASSGGAIRSVEMPAPVVRPADGCRVGPRGRAALLLARDRPDPSASPQCEPPVAPSSVANCSAASGRLK
jgi:hypothetical protein